MNDLEKNLRATGRPYLTVMDLINAGLASDVTPQAVFMRIGKLRGDDAPEAHGGMRVGGRIAFVADAGINYALHLQKLWSKS